MQYRSEIDGLRAIAVVPVMLFHAGLDLFSGGFVGVDVFFVISGYLITSIIIKEMEYSKFDLMIFYERRARRILPALLFVVLCCIPAAWILLFPSDMKNFSQSLVSVALFFSNILFWRESGYFDTSTDFKPLLHTWSLAVEEQFYILFPLFLMAAWRFGKQAIVWILIASFVVSLALAHWGAYNKPSATFYLLPTRAWELIIGSFAAFYLQRNEVCTPHWLNNILSTFGIAAILYSVFAFDNTTPFPSLYALTPTIGTVLVILFALRGTWAHTLLSLKIVVGIGLISYSLYLWHQPLFVLWRHYNVFETTDMQMLIATLVAIPLAVFTYYVVETPFRVNTAILNRRKMFSTFGFLLGAIIFFGTTGYITEGFSHIGEKRKQIANLDERISPNYGLHSDCEGDFNSFPNCYTSQEPEILLWGDSFAMHLTQGIIASEPHVRMQQHTRSACAPILDVAIFNTRNTRAVGAKCIEFNNNVLQWIERNKTLKLVIISSTFDISISKYLSENRIYSKNEGRNYLFRKMQDTINRIIELNLDVIVISPTPSSGRDNGRCVVKRIFIGLDTDICNFEYRNMEVGKFLEKIDNKFIFYWIHNDICENDICFTNKDGIIIFRDGGHLSKEGSHYLGFTKNWLPNWRKFVQNSERQHLVD